MTAEAWVRRGLDAVAMSRTADRPSELQGDLTRAVEAFDEALALDPGHVEALCQRAHALNGLGRDDEAADAFVAAAHAAPHDASLPLGAAVSLTRLGRLDAALACLDQALQLEPSSSEALFRRAEVLTRLQRHADALAAWEEVLARADTRALTTAAGAPARVVTHDFRRAQALLSRATLKAHLGGPGVDEAFDEALAAAGDALGGVSTPPVFLEALRTQSAARAAFSRSLAARGDQPSTRARAVQAWFQAGLLDEALRAAEHLARVAGDDAHAWYLKGEVHARRAERAAALECYERALALQPDFLGARARLKAVRDAP